MERQLPTTVLGRTGLTVTRLGIGGAYCPTVAGYRAALDTGVTYVDTARAYRDGDDERVIGEAIAGRRQSLVLATKTQSRDAAGARADLETSLRLLRTDYIDVWQIHYLNTEAERERVLGPGGAMEAAIKAREQGLVRYIGVTGHVWPEIAKAVATGLFDTVLCWYNASYREAEDTVFAQAMAQGAGVVIMNATRNDKLFGPDAPPAADFYRYVLSHEAVDVTIIGLRDVDLFRQMALALAWRDTLSPAERDALEAYGAGRRAAGALEM
ncbi:MAG TPA: aldo/keto reductase [Chloroflexi bacterium]|jgi:aryl-alcohol dehydrogenase-like predicted oxidoreductase|nr:aldo/keto reductase [Chloroflexota bacterium]